MPHLKRNQFLTRLIKEFNTIRASLMNWVPLATLDACLQEFIHEEQRCHSQVLLQEQQNLSFGGSTGVSDIASYASNIGKQGEHNTEKV